ncbi:MAG: hypothetical protein GF383_13350 [Candidatus Lokiarchaeota archaeon]|nr:hypothetical protein [Candidatus Lokiarchaeota archaeon]MBD3342177.1 hypothetical protein [Candidatus Lokiarchaeota archaeon]
MLRCFRVKIVVTGALQGGKSQYINYLDKNSLNVQVKRGNKFYTVAMDLGSIKLDKFEVFLFGTPGLLRFKVMREIVCSGADGYIFIFDAAKPEKDKEAISILNSIRKNNTPIVYAANKQDKENARDPATIIKQNNLSDDVKMFPTIATTGVNIKKSLEYLVNEIYARYKEILQILRDYETDIKGLAQKLKKNKAQMRDFLNNLEIKRFIKINRANRTYHVRELSNLI